MQLSYNVIKNNSVKKLGSKEIVTNSDIQYVCADLEDNAKLHIENYESLAKNMIENARKQSEAILQKAYEEAKKIQDDASAAAKELQQRAYNEGYSEGQLEGFNKAYHETIERARAESENIVNNAEELLKSAKDEYDNYVQSKFNELNDLIVAIAEKVLKRQFEDKEAIGNMIYETLEISKGSRSFIIRCNERYVEELKSQIFSWKEQLGFTGDIFVIKDENLELGNAIIDKGNGKIEVGIKFALCRIREILEGND
jgi:flagellar assembly protein FliH